MYALEIGGEDLHRCETITVSATDTAAQWLLARQTPDVSDFP